MHVNSIMLYERLNLDTNDYLLQIAIRHSFLLYIVTMINAHSHIVLREVFFSFLEMINIHQTFGFLSHFNFPSDFFTFFFDFSIIWVNGGKKKEKLNHKNRDEHFLFNPFKDTFKRVFKFTLPLVRFLFLFWKNLKCFNDFSFLNQYFSGGY